MARVASLRLSLHLTPVQSRRSGSRKRGFTLLGFPTVVRPGFPLFVVLIAFLYPWPLGAWIAVSIAVFTVVHELGHALVARWFGCEARISLDFMVAYAAFSPAPGLSRVRKGLIAVAGASFQVGLALVVLAAMGVNPFSRADISATDAGSAVWWTGIALGLINLVPLVPLDGGAVVSNILDALFPGRGQSIMLRISIVMCSTVLAVLVTTGQTSFIAFFAFLLYLQWRTLRAERVVGQLVESRLSHPLGEPSLDAVVAGTYVDTGEHHRALDYSREGFSALPSSDLAVVAARACAALGMDDAALEWVGAAVNASMDDIDVLARLNTATELDRLRADPRFAVLVRELTARD